MKPSILIVDDEEPVRRLMRRALEQADYFVLEATTGKEALDQIRSNEVDLVITDIVMPDMEGLELTRLLKSSRPELKVIAVSGAFDGMFLRAAALLGVMATLQKPFGPDALLKMVAECLQGSPGDTRE